MQIRVFCPAALTDAVVRVLTDEPWVSALVVNRGDCVRPRGDVVIADVPREIAAEVVERLEATGVAHEGTIHFENVESWISQSADQAERAAPGFAHDAVVWADAEHKARADTEIDGVYLAFFTLATLLAGIAIIVDSPILTVGAMVLGPEFGAIAALGLALVRRRPDLWRRATVALTVGFVSAIVITTLVTLAGRALGWVTVGDVAGPRPGTAFIYTPDKWSFIVAVIAAMAGVLSITSARVMGISGVFISVTTIPAAGNIAMALAFGLWTEVRGSALQLALNITGMAIAGWLTLAFQHHLSQQMRRLHRRKKSMAR